VNFGESLAYWYFRLNGFLPLANFVLHRPDALHRQSSDSDILAVRFPHVHEDVGGQPGDWDNELFAEWGLDHFNRTVCVIAEIKTGLYTEASVNRAFAPRRVIYALRRIGVVTLPECEEVSHRLSREGVVHHREFSFAKILVSSSARRTGNFENTSPCLQIELGHTVDFIRTRMNRYRNEKEAARMFFPGDLIQFFAWEAGVSMAHGPLENGE
jgi:hypothetical protein